jgi:hypothetical protein
MKSVVMTMLLLFAVSVSAQPRVTNGDVRAASISGGLTRAELDRFAQAAGTQWLAYAVPLVEGDRWICDGMHVNGSESITIQSGRDNRAGTTVMMLEGPRQMWVLFRTDGGAVNRIRLASENCTLDAGGLTVNWVADVAPAQSVALLSSFLVAGTPNRVADGALTALAMHREPAALERLLVTAREGATPHLRGQALFWLSQRAGDRAVGAISDAIANDPETAVKKRAVFALSQLPKDEGVPRLIDIARTNNNPAVRKQAMFWLGQTRDPRAVKFFEEILFK